MITPHEFAIILFNKYLQIYGRNYKYIKDDLMIKDITEQIMIINKSAVENARPYMWFSSKYKPWRIIHEILRFGDAADDVNLDIRENQSQRNEINTLIECYRIISHINGFKQKFPDLIVSKLRNYYLSIIQLNRITVHKFYDDCGSDVDDKDRNISINEILPKLGIFIKVQDLIGDF